LYCKAGAGYCAKDAAGVERCTGSGGGGGGGTVTSVDCIAGLTCTPDPITGSGTTGIGPAQVTDTMLADNYSGVGACAASKFVTTLNDDAAPTCTQPAFSDISGTLALAQVTDDASSGKCLVSGGGAGDPNWATCPGGSTAFSSITTGVNTIPATMTVGNGSSMLTSGTGTIAATTATALAANPTDCSANQYATTIAANGNLTCAQVDYSQLTGTPSTFAPAAHNFLDSTVHNNTLTGTPVRGDLVVANSTPAWAKLAKGTADQAFRMDGTGTDPGWGTLPLATGTSGNYVADTTCGNGIDCSATSHGATISFNTDSSEDQFMFDLGSTNLNCVGKTGAAGVGSSGAINGLLQYCSAAVLKTAALGNATGESTAAANGSVNLATDITGTLPLANLTDDAAASKCLVSGGGLGDPNWATCPGGGSFTLSDGTNTQTINSGDTMTAAAGNGLDVLVGATDTFTFSLESPIYVTNTAGVDCTGATDSTAGVNTALTAAAGKTLLIPGGCKLGLASPASSNTFCTASGAPLPCCTGSGTGTCHVSLSVPSNTHIFCVDSTAGFVALKQRCTGGTYPGAACNVDAECLGGGTCDNDFGSASANPCTSSTCYAPTAADTYIMVHDSSTASDGIRIDNCSFWTGQADPFQRCTGTGGNSGDPCRQECAGGGFVGFGCQQDSDCPGSTCLRTADCTGGAGTGTCGAGSSHPCCSGVPHSASSVSTAKIDPIALERTTTAQLYNINVYDHFVGDFAVKTNHFATLSDVNGAAEITSCTTPLPASPGSTNSCLNGSKGACCYGPALFATPAPVQPTTAVTDGIVVGAGSQLGRVSGRGTTTGISSSCTSCRGVRMDECTIIPTASTGPGTASQGFKVGQNSVIAKSQAQFIASGGTGINLNGTDASAIENKIGGAATTGVLLNAADGRSTDNIIVFSSGASSSAIGIDIEAANASVNGNYVSGNMTAGTGIKINGSQGTISNNQIVSTSNDTLQNAMIFDTNGSSASVTGNYIQRVHDNAFWLKGAVTNIRIIGNTSSLGNAAATTALHPIHVLNDGSGNQHVIQGNIFEHGWRGYATGAASNSLTNTIISGNRFVGLSGAPMAAGGAGVAVASNYFNLGGALFSPGVGLTCDASCSNRGVVCQQDSDCTSCNGSVQKCIPEAIVGYIGAPTASNPATHNSWVGNIVFNSNQTTKQCGGTTTFAGSQCATAGNTCAGGASCTGGPPSTCASGSESGVMCCAGAAPTCTARTDTPYLRAVDYGAATAISLFMFSGNQVFGGNANAVGIDFQSSASLGNLTVGDSAIIGNIFYGGGFANTTGIKYSTSGTYTNVNVNGNNFTQLTTDIANYKSTYGENSFPPATANIASDFTTGSTTFVNVTGLQFPILANRAYNFRCDFLYTAAATTTGIAFAMTGPTSPTTFTYATRICTGINGTAGQGTICTTASTDAFFEQVGNGDDSTATATTDTFSTTNPSFAKIEGIILNGANAGNLTARVKAEVAANVTVKAGSSCIVYQTPAGS